MKPLLTHSIHASLLASRAALGRTALLALVLLSLPGAAWAQQVAVSGQVKFSDGSPLASATVYALKSWEEPLTTGTDASGRYALFLPPGTYDLVVRFSTPGFSGSHMMAQALSITTSRQLNVTVSDIVFNGRVVNSSGQPVAGVELTGYGSTSGGPSSLFPISDADGRIQVRMMRGTYERMRLTPPAGSSYAITALADETFPFIYAHDFVLADALLLSGQVKFADGSPAPSATVYVNTTTAGLSPSTSTDASGHYTLKLTPGLYDVLVQLSSPGFSGQQLMAQSLIMRTHMRLDLTLSDIVLSGRVVNSSGQPVSNVQLWGNGYLNAGTLSLSPISGADGRFQVRILPGTYSGMQLYPQAGSPYAITLLPDATFTTTTTLQDYVLTDAIILSGQVRFSDGSPVTSASVFTNAASGAPSVPADTNGSGHYALSLLPDTHDVFVQFSSPGFSGGQRMAQAMSITTSTQLDMPLSDIMLEGRIVNGSGQPIAGVQLSGYASSGGGPNSLSPVSGTDGRFQVRLMPGDYSSMRLVPDSSSGYLQTTLPDETFSASSSRQYVLEDRNECLAYNGGCNVNATCTNLPGSRSCACNPGYTGDGLTCERSPGRVIINEILANEPGSATASEFVELVNIGGTAIDIGGWTVSDAASARHTFAAGTVLAPGKAVAVFGAASGVPTGMSNAVGSTTGTLSLNNTTDTVTVKDAANSVIDTFTYSSALAAADGVSMNRTPDATAGAGWVLHNSVSSLASSAGKRANGNAF